MSAAWRPRPNVCPPPGRGPRADIAAEGFLLGPPGAGADVSSWQGVQVGALALRAGETSALLQLRFLDADSTAYAVADTCSESHLECQAADSSVLAIQREPGSEWSFRLIGRSADATTLMLNCHHEDHVQMACGPIAVTVTPTANHGPRLSGRIRIEAELAGVTGEADGTRRYDDADGTRAALPPIFVAGSDVGSGTAWNLVFKEPAAAR